MDWVKWLLGSHCLPVSLVTLAVSVTLLSDLPSDGGEYNSQANINSKI